MDTTPTTAPDLAYLFAEAKRLGLTYTEFAAGTGVSYSAVVLYEKGTRNPSPRWLRRADLCLRRAALDQELRALEREEIA